MDQSALICYVNCKKDWFWTHQLRLLVNLRDRFLDLDPVLLDFLHK